MLPTLRSSQTISMQNDAEMPLVLPFFSASGAGELSQHRKRVRHWDDIARIIGTIESRLGIDQLSG